LQVASVANCGEIYTLLKANLDELAAMLGSAQLEQIDRALPTALALRSSP
jgi:mRNA-degrading endonuclease toxin of MazEF toxin-antitoxin module